MCFKILMASNNTITLTTTIEPSDTDPTFAFGKRPTKATMVKAPTED